MRVRCGHLLDAAVDALRPDALRVNVRSHHAQHAVYVTQIRSVLRKLAFRVRNDTEFGGDTPLGRRRTELGSAPPPIEISAEALIEREPVTVLCSEKGWIPSSDRSMSA